MQKLELSRWWETVQTAKRPGATECTIVDFDRHSGDFNLNELAINAKVPGGAERELRWLLVGYIADGRLVQPYSNLHHSKSTTQGAT